MAQADIEIVCGSHEAFRRRDLEAFVDHMDPDVEFTSLILEVEGTYRGHDGIRSWWNDVLGVFPDWQPQVEDAREVGNRVVLRVRVEGSGTGSGIDLDRDIWQVAQVEGGRLRAWKFFRTEQEALDAALRPER
jgi:ketosteroid isomerase-like protein